MTEAEKEEFNEVVLLMGMVCGMLLKEDLVQRLVAAMQDKDNGHKLSAYIQHMHNKIGSIIEQAQGNQQ